MSSGENPTSENKDSTSTSTHNLNNGDEHDLLEDEFLKGDTTETVAITQEEFEEKVNDAVKRALSELDFSKIFRNAMPPMSAVPLTSVPPRVANPIFSFPVYEKEDKLIGTKNYVVWRQRFELDLRTNRLSSYITHELGSEDIPLDQKEQMDAATFRHLRNTCAQDIANSLMRFKNAFLAMKHIEVYYGGKKLQELIRLEIRSRRLHYADHFKPVQFVTDFETINEEYKELGTNYDDEYLVAKFLAGIDNRHVQGHPLAIFYSTMLALPQEQRTIEYVKQCFLNLDHGSLSSQNRKNYAERRPIQSNNFYDNPKRFKPNDEKSSERSSQTLSVAELLKKKRVSMYDLYNDRQRQKLQAMSRDEKKRNQCERCLTYFHRSINCMFKVPFCYNCFRFGHGSRDCKAEKRKPRSA